LFYALGGSHQLCQIVEIVWDLEPLPTSSTKRGERGVLKNLG
jgi:hypothetical protein